MSRQVLGQEFKFLAEEFNFLGEKLPTAQQEALQSARTAQFPSEKTAPICLCATFDLYR